MDCRIYFQQVETGIYDVIVIPLIHPSAQTTELSSELIPKKAKIRMITFLLGTALAVSIPVTQIKANDNRYSMTYLSYGSYEKQLEYVAISNGGFSVISPSYFNLESDGSLTVEKVSPDYVDAMHQKGVRIVPFLSNHWNRTAGSNALKNPHLLASQIADAVEKYHLDGVNVDIENVPYKKLP